MTNASLSLDTDTAYRRGVILVLLAGTCWSIMGLGVRSMEAATAWQILFYRSIALSSLLIGYLWMSRGTNPLRQIYRAGWPAWTGAAALCVAFGGGVSAIQMTTVANAMFLFASAPFFAALLGWLLLGERVRRSTWLAMLAAAVGITIMVGDGFAMGHGLGNTLAILSALGFAFFTLALRQGRAGDMMPTIALAGLYMIAVAYGICTWTGTGIGISNHDIAIAAGMGVFQLGLGLILYTIGSRDVPAGDLALLSMTEVVLGPFWVWLILGETPGQLTFAGGAILLAAIAGNAISGMRRRPLPVGLK